LYLIGAEGFGRACGAHFKKFAWDNATLNDLIESLNVEFIK
jgi:aminopeptidase N